MKRDGTWKQRNKLPAYKIKSQRIAAGDRCARCGSAERLELDHIVPLWNGGTNDPDNLQLLCYTCHKLKTSDERKLYKRLHPQIMIVDGVRKPCKQRW